MQSALASCLPHASARANKSGGGVVAVGDSIHGGFTRQQFILPQSWAQHLANIGGGAFTKYAHRWNSAWLTAGFYEAEYGDRSGESPTVWC